MPTTARRPSKPRTKKSNRKSQSARPSRKRGMTPEDITRIRFVNSPRISHDGSRILFSRKHVGERNEYKTNLWIVPTDGRGEPAQFTSGDSDSTGEWSRDDAMIAFIRSRKEEGTSQVHLLSTEGGEARQLTKFPEGKIQSFKWSPDGKSLAVAFRPTHTEWTKKSAKEREKSGASTPPRVIEDLWYRLDGDGYFLDSRYALYLVDTQTGEHRLIFDKDDLGAFDYDFSPDGRTLAISANPTKNALVRPWNATIYLLDTASGRVSTVPDLPKGPKTHLRFSPDGRLIAYAGRIGDEAEYSTENLELFVCDAKKGNARSLTGTTDYCLMAIALSDTSEAVFGPSFEWHPDSHRIICQIGWHGESHLTEIRIKGGAMKFLTKGAFDHTLGSIDSRGQCIAIARMDAVTPPEIGAIDLKHPSRPARMLTAFNRDLLKEVQIIAPTAHWIKSADGNDVHIWVLRPNSSAKKKMPAVLEIHGGPHAQYGIGFFHEFQCLAAAGYAVFYSNPRGSKGYGRDHCHAIRGAWGTADWVDIQAVTEFMKKQAFVDTNRMGVMGGSYGGYMTNWVIGHTREFKGAITDRCVSNLVSMWGNSDFPGREDRYWKGNAWDRPEELWKYSPLRLMGNARTPTLIIHSEGDLRCNIEQAEQVFTVLRSKNVPTRFVRYPASTSHGFSRMGPPDLRIHRLHEILNWWKKHLSNTRK